jgi:hypothetical protein
VTRLLDDAGIPPRPEELGGHVVKAAGLNVDAEGPSQVELCLTEEADMYPEVTENLLEATSRDAVRSRAMTGKPARQLRTRWTEAWEQPDAPDPLPMPLQGLLYAEAAGRFSRVHSKEFGGNPAGHHRQHRQGEARPAGRARHGRGLDRRHGLAQRPHGRRRLSRRLSRRQQGQAGVGGRRP